MVMGKQWFKKATALILAMVLVIGGMTIPTANAAITKTGPSVSRATGTEKVTINVKTYGEDGTIEGNLNPCVGETVTLKAVPKDGCYVVGWLENGVPVLHYGDTYTVEAETDKNLSVFIVPKGKYYVLAYLVDSRGEGRIDSQIHAPGEKCYVEYDAASGYRLDSVRYGLLPADGDIESITEWRDLEKDIFGAEYFVMPEGNAVIHFDFLSTIPHTVTCATTGAGTATLDRPSGIYYEGETVTLTLTPGDNQELTELGIPDHTTVLTEGDRTIVSFEMHNKDISCWAKFEPKTVTTVFIYPQGGGSAGIVSGPELGSKTATAQPNPGYVFKGWREVNPDTEYVSDTVLSTDPVFTFARGEYKYLLAEFHSDTYKIIIPERIEHGSVEIVNPKESYQAGETITLRANPDENYTIAKYGYAYIADDGTTQTVEFEGNQFVMPASDVALSALFVPLGYLTIDINPKEGGTINYESGYYPSGKEITLQAKPADGYVLKHWEHNGQIYKVQEVSFTMPSGDVLITAVFEKDPDSFLITAKSDSDEGGSVKGGGRYKKRAIYTVSAIAAAGYRFVNWTEDGKEVSRLSNYSAFAEGNHDYVAHFERIPVHRVRVDVNLSFGAEATGGGRFEEGTEITVSATAPEEYRFVNWTVDGIEVSTDQNYRFKVEKDVDLTANFAIKEFLISAKTNTAEKGSVTGAGTFQYAAGVTLEAVPKEGSVFRGWMENGEIISVNPILTFQAYADRNLIAMFGDTTLSNWFDIGLGDIYIGDGYVKQNDNTYQETNPVIYGITEDHSVFIESEAGHTVTVTLSELNIKRNTPTGVEIVNGVIPGNPPAAVGVSGDGDVTLIIKQENTLTSSWYHAGIQTQGNGSLTITGDGKVTATGGGARAAGIGCSRDDSCGAIIIEGSVSVYANGTTAGGIGASSDAKCSSIRIGENAFVSTTGKNGGGIYAETIVITDSAEVIVRADTNGAGIGGFAKTAPESITISGNAKVDVETTDGGAAIGGDYGQEGKNITITDNAQVSAKSKPNYGDIDYNSGAAIGGGRQGDGTNIVISGNAVVSAQSQRGAAAIGGGCYGNGSNIVIKDNAVVKAVEVGAYGAGIGGGRQGNGTGIVIQDNAVVTAISNGSGGAGIGGGGDAGGIDIVIKGNATVIAQATDLGGAGIGGGMYGNCNGIKIIENATVIARGACGGAGIGGGFEGKASNIVIGGKTVVDAVEGEGYLNENKVDPARCAKGAGIGHGGHYISYDELGINGGEDYTMVEDFSGEIRIYRPKTPVEKIQSGEADEMRDKFVTVTFRDNTDSQLEKTQKVTCGAYTLLATDVFRRSEYRVCGWNTKADGTGISYGDGEQVCLTQDLVLYAKWEHIHEFLPVVDEKFFVSGPTCEHGAVYYKSCACGKTSTETFESGEPNGHRWKEIPGDEARQCEVCGAIEDIEVRYNPVGGETITWTRGSKENIVLTFKRNTNDASCFSHYRKTLIDGQEVSVDARSGSTIITIPADMLEQLADGKHTITAVFDDWSADVALTIPEQEKEEIPPVEEEKPPVEEEKPPVEEEKTEEQTPESPKIEEPKPVISPKTGDTNPIVIMLILVVLAAGIVGAVQIRRRKSV